MEDIWPLKTLLMSQNASVEEIEKQVKDLNDADLAVCYKSASISKINATKIGILETEIDNRINSKMSK